MNLSELTIETLAKAIMKVNKQRADEEQCKSLFDVAAKDTPVIDALLRELRKLFASAEKSATDKGIQVADRDLTILLALRAIERGEVR